MQNLTKDDYANLFWCCVAVIEQSNEKLKDPKIKQSKALTQLYGNNIEIYTKIKEKLENIIYK